MSEPTPKSPILELYVALTTGDNQRLMRFYQDGLGLQPAQLWTAEQQGQAAI